MPRSSNQHGAAGGEQPLQARLAVEPHPDASCGVLEAGDRGTDVVRNSVSEAAEPDEEAPGAAEPGEEEPGAADGCRCNATVTVESGGERHREFVSGRVGGYCICPAFQRTNCTVEICGTRDGTLLLEVTVPERAALRTLVSRLRDREARVSLRRVLPLDAAVDATTDTLRLDAREITEKQREALELAVERGYYETPRRADLGDLADALGVSRSAVSQRLNAAEATLVRELVDLDAETRGGATAAANGGPDRGTAD